MLNTLLNKSGRIYQNIIRNYARKKLANPGIQKQINILEERDETNLENINVEELESDFMRLGEVHRQHEQELDSLRDKEKYWIVKRKYFKENQLNFLTWNDKEQIRYLHQSNPTEWTIEKLSEGFPAQSNIISKIIRNKWNKNESKRERHDKAVENNWKLLKEGKIDLPENLKEHLLKFTSRKPNTQQQQKIVNVVTASKKGEFSSIIESYQPKAKPNITENSEKIFQNLEKDRFLKEPSSLYGNKMVPLRFIKKPEIKADNGTEVNVELDTLFHGKDASKNKYITKFKSESATNKSLVTQYPEKITIPKGKFKRGCTYKVNDCYYDDDGIFLYRVPGMY